MTPRCDEMQRGRAAYAPMRIARDKKKDKFDLDIHSKILDCIFCVSKKSF